MDLIQKLKPSIDPIVSLTDAELTILGGVMETRRLKKGSFFLKEGQICSFVGYIHSGVLVYYKNMDNGDEKTTDFAFEGDWVNNNQSRLTNTPSAINIRAIEDTEIQVMNQHDLTQLYIQVPKIERLGRILMEREYLKLVDQTVELQIHTAKERFENMVKKHPEILQKVQLYHIANYLGIAPKSLSRIRKEIFGR
jgi:CRP-like cAMP-binding protein